MYVIEFEHIVQLIAVNCIQSIVNVGQLQAFSIDLFNLMSFSANFQSILSILCRRFTSIAHIVALLTSSLYYMVAGRLHGRGGSANSSQIKVTKMLLIVSSVFVLLNLPSYLIRVMAYVEVSELCCFIDERHLKLNQDTLEQLVLL